MTWSCASKKEKEKVSFIKNVTAHYNIYFNARELLNQSELTIRKSTEDDFNQILAIFPLPDEESSANETVNIEQVIQKCNTIALEKYESNWLDDAYLLLAKAEYLKGDFYNAVAYYSYVSVTFPKEKKNKLTAYLGQVKSDFALKNVKEADSVLQLAINLKYKYNRYELEALQAQLALEKNDVSTAVTHLQKAVNSTSNSYLKIRWRYILAQLQEEIQQKDAAYSNYDKIVKSNASFEMSFNANLARIRINEGAEGKQFDKIATLKKLLKEDKNREFKEQIYFQIANVYAEKGDLKKATEFYKTSAHTIPGTVKQKGLSFLKLAELSFDSLKNYTQAQLYFDSTMQYLPKNYPNYKSIAVKANNLQYLADRLTIIAQQKKLLQLANLSDKELDSKVDEIIKEKQSALIINQTPINNINTLKFNDSSTDNGSGGSFYFYNSTALSKGLNEFKKRWGNRKLADNWRYSINSLSADGVKNTNDAVSSSNLVANIESISAAVKDSIKTDFLKGLPFNPAAKQLANDKIAKALYEIAIFYKDVLKDNNEAAEALEAILINYPNDINAASIYYQLFRLLEKDQPQKSQVFKNQLLEKFPNSVYAKTLSDSNFGKEEELVAISLKTSYQKIYDLYLQKKYVEVINQISALRDSLKSFNKLEPQFAYLNALAIGNTKKVPAFLASLDEIVKNYPTNEEITPLVKQQIDYINAHKNIFDQRPTALIAYDANDAIETGKEVLSIPKVGEPKKVNQPAALPQPKKEIVQANPQPINPPVSVPIIEKPKAIVFDLNDRQKHLIVIDIKDPDANIAQPFSSVSQYFYSKFDPSAYNLVIRILDKTNKFIIINGEFYSKSEAEKVALQLYPELPKLLKGTAKEYKNFVISESNLKFLTTSDAVDQYLKSISDKK